MSCNRLSPGAFIDGTRCFSVRADVLCPIDLGDFSLLHRLVLIVLSQILVFSYSGLSVLHECMVMTGSSLNLRSICLFRFIVGLCTYTIMALMYSLTNLAFRIPMDGYFSQGVGFMVFWMLNTCTILAGKLCAAF